MRRFAFRLAGALGLPASDVLDGMTSTEISEWMAYRKLELLPGERLEMLVATLCALVANMFRGERDEPHTALDFLPWLQDDDEDPEEERTPEDMVRMLEMLNAAFGGRDLRTTEAARSGDRPQHETGWPDD